MAEQTKVSKSKSKKTRKTTPKSLPNDSSAKNAEPASSVAPKTANKRNPYNHPTYLQMAAKAIAALKERKGSSRPAILKYILANYKVGNDPKNSGFHMNLALKHGLEGGQFKHGGSTSRFRLGDAIIPQDKKKSIKKPASEEENPTKSNENPTKSNKKPKKSNEKPTKSKSEKSSKSKKTVAKPSKTNSTDPKPKKTAATKPKVSQKTTKTKPAAVKKTTSKKSPEKKKSQKTEKNNLPPTSKVSRHQKEAPKKAKPAELAKKRSRK